MDYLDDPEREVLTRQILCASSLPEVEAALTALRGWRKRYPEDRDILDAGEQLSLIHDALLEDNPSPWTEWQHLEYQVMGARTLPSIKGARYALRWWAEQHPGETAPDLLEGLFFLLDVVEDQQRGASTLKTQTGRELAGQAV